jgi:hypothetical protein
MVDWPCFQSSSSVCTWLRLDASTPTYIIFTKNDFQLHTLLTGIDNPKFTAFNQPFPMCWLTLQAVKLYVESIISDSPDLKEVIGKALLPFLLRKLAESKNRKGLFLTASQHAAQKTVQHAQAVGSRMHEGCHICTKATGVSVDLKALNVICKLKGKHVSASYIYQQSHHFRLPCMHDDKLAVQ